MKKLTALVLVLILAVQQIPFALLAGELTVRNSSFYVGSGTLQDPYQIANTVQLGQMAQQVNNGNETGKYYILTANINFSGLDWTPIGNEDHPFSGVFDGNNHTIRGLSVAGHDYAGLFGYSSSGVIKNLSIRDSVISGVNYVGSIAGLSLGNTSIENCYNDSNVICETAQYVGGIVGSTDGDIKNCYNAGDILSVTVTSQGGIAGASEGNITGCTNTGTVLVLEAAHSVGGIAGFQYPFDEGNKVISACYNIGGISAPKGYLGGIAGISNRTILRCGNAGTITESADGKGQQGGIAGSAKIINESYNTGMITGSNANGICASISERIQNTYNAGKISGSTDSAGITSIVFSEAVLSNCYWLKGTAKKGIISNNNDNCEAVKVKEKDLCDPAWIQKNLGEAFFSDQYGNYNDGFPILKDINYNPSVPHGGTFRFPSGSANDETDYTAAYYYDDDYFSKNASEYQNSLATMSLCLALSAWGSNIGGTSPNGELTEWVDYNGNGAPDAGEIISVGNPTYGYKYRNAEALLSDIGFGEHFEYNEHFEQKPDINTMGVVISHKNIKVKGKTYTLIALATRGGGYEAEWAGNLTVGESGQHEGFKIASEIAYDFLKGYIYRHKDEFQSEIKLWCAGYSRAGAAVNLLAGRLVDEKSIADVSIEPENLYAYCFEPPMGARIDDVSNRDLYSNIHNIVNPSDLVPKVAPNAWGFARYGVDEKDIIPEGRKKENADKYAAMLGFFKALDTPWVRESLVEVNGEWTHMVDTFQGKTAPLGDPFSWQDTDVTMSDFLDNLFLSVANGLGSRGNYYELLQPSVQTMVSQLTGEGDAAESWNRAFDLFGGTLKSEIINIISVWVSQGAEAAVDEMVNHLILCAKIADVNVAEDELHGAMVTAVRGLINAIIYSYNANGYDTLFTLVSNADKLAPAHYPELCLAWLQTQDDNYNETEKFFLYDKIKDASGGGSNLPGDAGFTNGVNELYDYLDLARKTMSPLIIDLDGDGLDTLSLENGAYFDHLGNNFKVKTGWAGAKDGLLVRDLSDNGKIDSGLELFGDSTRLLNGERATNGFESLKDLDDNGDDVFDENDVAWSQVKIWIDGNGNAIADEGELITLEETGIASISLDYENINLIDAHGNSHKQISTVTKTDGTIVDIVDVWFARDLIDSSARETVDVRPEISLLPDIKGYGTTYSLHQAMARDTNNQLMALLEQFAAEEDETARRKIASQIIYSWTLATDAWEVAEALVGEKYTGGRGPNATKVINTGVNRTADVLYNNLMAKTHYGYLYESMTLYPDGTLYDMSDAAYEILEAMEKDQVAGERLLLEFVLNLYQNLALDKVDIEGFKDILAAENKRCEIIADLVNKNIVFGTDGNDTIRGTNAGNVFWFDRGNNTIYGGNGDNTYFLGKDFGTNTIIDAGGTNTIFFLSDMKQVNVQVMPNTYDVELTAADATGKMILKNFNQNATYKLVFADGNTFNMNLMELVPSEGTINIRTAKDLSEIRNNLFGNYRLMADIDLSGIEWTPIGTNAAPFIGTFDGNGYTIKNLKVNLPNQNYAGLFGYNGGTIENLTLDGVQVSGGSYVGGLVGYNTGSITNSTVKNASTISGSYYVGGLIGLNSGTGSIADVAVSGIETLKSTYYSYAYIGGLVGQNAGSIVNGSAVGVTSLSGTGSYVGGFVGHNTGTIQKSYTTNPVSGGSYVGGFVGYTGSGIIEQCYATGNVSATGDTIGGFAGYITGSASIIRDSFSNGNVVAGSNTAGFVGTISSGKVENCYSASNNTNGFNYNGTVTNCYFDNSLLYTPTAKPEARTTEQMMSQSNYTGWDFDSIWEIAEGQSYPTLLGLEKPIQRTNKYIEISTANELKSIRNDLFGNYCLAADIDLSDIEWTPIGTSSAPFGGVFDGNGYTIRNLNVNLPNQDYTGLFGYNRGAAIINLKLDGLQVTGRSYAGGLAGRSDGIIMDCTAAGITTLTGSGSNVGGLVGYNTGSITNSRAAGSALVTGSVSYVGGFVGCNTGTITKSFAANDVRGGGYVGGFAGQTNNGAIEQCYATGNVNAAGDYVGGFAGHLNNGGGIHNCFSTGIVAAGKNTAGFVGYISSGKVENCYSLSGNTNGFNYNGTVTNCYFDSDLILVPVSKPEARTTEQMKKASTYDNWNFDDIWTIDEGNGYPVLRTLQKPVFDVEIIEIDSPEELNGIRNKLSGRYRLTTDIDLSGIAWTPIGTSTAPFAGILDGNGYIIKNLNVNQSNQDYVGLFGYSRGMIANLKLEDMQVTGRSYVGSLTGRNDGEIYTCIVRSGVAVRGIDYTGGLTGSNTGNIIDSTAAVSMLSGTGIYVGGFVGHNTGSIQKSHATSPVNGGGYVGGFAGYTGSGTIEQCYATSNVSATGDYIGGFVGYIVGSASIICDSFSTGNVVSGSYTAGFVGYISSGKVENCYSTSNNPNGFNYNGTVTNCYFNSDLMLVPVSKPEARTTAQMKSKATYIDWDFDNVWEIEEGHGYPILREYDMPIMDANEYVDIKTAKELSDIRNNLFGNYRLTADIDLSDIEWTPIGTGAAPFAGILDGNGYTIKNLNVNLPNQDYVGLFGYNRGATIINLKLGGAQVTGRSYVGGLAGRSNGIIMDCTITGITTLTGSSTYVGGLVGYNTGSITNSSVKNSSTISGSYYVGGLTGYNSNTGTIADVAVSDIETLKSTYSGNIYIGGLVGQNAGNIVNGSAVGVTSLSGAGNYVGGFVGYNTGNIQKSYTTNPVSGTGSYVGGFTGYTGSGTIEQCYATGNVSTTGDYIGGFVGNLYGSNSIIRNSFSTGNVVAGSFTAGFVGYISSGKVENCYSTSNNPNGVNYNGTVMGCYFDSSLIAVPTAKSEARTTEQMMTQSNYTGWDFDSIWEIAEGQTYPTLRGLEKPIIKVTGYVGIKTATELSAIRNNLFGNYRLMANIDLSGTDWTPIGTSSTPFGGVLDGNGYTIKNLNVNLPNQDYVGLFGYNRGAAIINLKLDGVQVTGRSYAGGLAGRSDGILMDCTVTGITTLSGSGSYIGGLVGYNTGDIKNSSATGSSPVSGNGNNVGGFVGYNSGAIQNSNAKSNVSGTGSYVGGFVGHNTGNIQKSYTTNPVSGGSYVGGFAGYMSGGAIGQCYATGNVSAAGEYIGGFVGNLYGSNSIIRNSFSTGNVVAGNNTAGFAGAISYGKIEYSYSLANNTNGFHYNGNVFNCYFDSNLLPLPTVKAEARTTEQMQSKLNYIDWDYINVWEIKDGQGYPTLRGLEKPIIKVTEYVEIKTAAEFSAIRNNLFGNYRLMANIDLSGIEWVPIGTSSAPFAGILNGNGYTIKNLNINLLNQDYAGLFGYNRGAAIINLKLDGVKVTGRSNVGGLAGRSDGILMDCTVTGITNLTGSSNYVGGLVGYNTGSITRGAVYEIKSMTGGGYTGGLAGSNTGKISDSQATGILSIKGGYDTGGLVGINNNGSITNSWASGISLTGTGSVGGFIGTNYGVAKYCYSMIDVTGSLDNVGGFSGYSNGSTMEQCYATGNVTSGGRYLGGFAGQIHSNTVIRNCFATGSVVAGSNSAGFVGQISSGKVENCYSASNNPNGFNSNGTVTSCYFNSDLISVPLSKPEARTTEQMMRKANYTGWDFNGIWEIAEGQGYPTLRKYENETPLSYGISLDKRGTVSLPSTVEGYAEQTAMTVMITNSGSTNAIGLTAALISGNTSAFTVTQPQQANLAENETTAFTIVPNSGLKAGTYTAGILISGDNGIRASLTVIFTVKAAPSPTPLPAPSPGPSPEPSPAPTPNPTPEPSPGTTPESDSKITINGQSMDIAVSDDGALRIKFTEEDIERYSDDSSEFNVVVQNHTNIMLFMSISALATDSLVVKTDFGVISIPNQTLNMLSSLYGDMLRLVIVKGSFRVVLLDENEKEIECRDFENPFTLTLPYKLEGGQSSNAVVAIDDEGKVIPFAVYRDGSITFNITKTGKYDVIYNSSIFPDISNHWAEEHLRFALARGLFIEDEDQSFDPDAVMTRAAFVQTLAKLDGADLSAYSISSFSGASDGQWHTEVLEWAADICIMNAGSKLNPEREITRQEMVFILANYAKYKGYVLPAGKTSNFADEAKISTAAYDAVKTLQAAGILHAKPGNLFDPQGSVSQAEAAAILAQFVHVLAA